jgi:hypothetical protein
MGENDGQPWPRRRADAPAAQPEPARDSDGGRNDRGERERKREPEHEDSLLALAGRFGDNRAVAPAGD